MENQYYDEDGVVMTADEVIDSPAQQPQAQVQKPPQADRKGVLTNRIAERLGVNSKAFYDALRTKHFATKNGPELKDDDMMMLLVIVDQYRLNPLNKEIYAVLGKGGKIIPIVSVDGWSRIINEHPQFDGIEFTFDGNDSCTCTIYRKDRNYPTRITEYMDECKVAGSIPWTSHPKRMLRHRAMIQCARVAFGYSGIKDPEGNYVDDVDMKDMGQAQEKPRQFSALRNSGVLGERLNDFVQGLIPRVKQVGVPALINYAKQHTSDSFELEMIQSSLIEAENANKGLLN